MFDQPCQRGHLPLNPETLTIGNKAVTISGDPSKQPNDNIKTKLKNNSTTTTQEAWQGINNITGFNPLGARFFFKKMLDFDIKISKACGLKGLKDRDLL